MLDSTVPIHISDIEAAINHWRAQCPCSDGATLGVELSALAEVYAGMVWQRQAHIAESALPAQARDAWLAWADAQPDTPCIAICSTSQGDDMCKGCGRSFAEVREWVGMGAAQKRAVWRRIRQEGTALRFSRYAERAQ